MIIHDIPQRSPEWYQLRTGKVTASNAHRLLTPAKLKTYQTELLAETLTGTLTEHFVSAAMEWGIEKEQFAIQWYEAQLEKDLNTQTVGFCVHETYHMAGCSPDLLVGNDGLMEAKCPTTKNHLEYYSNGPSPEYMAQIQFQLFVTGRQWCDFVTFDPRLPKPLNGKVFHIKRDEKLIEKLKNGLLEISSFIAGFMIENGINQNLLEELREAA